MQHTAPMPQFSPCSWQCNKPSGAPFDLALMNWLSLKVQKTRKRTAKSLSVCSTQNELTCMFWAPETVVSITVHGTVTPAMPENSVSVHFGWIHDICIWEDKDLRVQPCNSSYLDDATRHKPHILTVTRTCYPQYSSYLPGRSSKCPFGLPLVNLLMQLCYESVILRTIM